jgi:hypothetical protein
VGCYQIIVYKNNMSTFQQLPYNYNRKSEVVPMHAMKATGEGGGEVQLHSFLNSVVGELSPLCPVSITPSEGVAGTDLT